MTHVTSSAISLVSHVGAHSTDTSNVTTGAIDTTGANLLILAAGFYPAITGVPTITDSKGNTWTGLVAQDDGQARVRLWYSTPTTVGAGHTFTLAGSLTYPAIVVGAFGNAKPASPFDTQTGTAVPPGSTSFNSGALLPSLSNELIVSAIGLNQASGTLAVDSGMSIVDQVNGQGGSHDSIGMAYIVQTTATSINPMWSWVFTTDGGVTTACFKAP